MSSKIQHCAFLEKYVSMKTPDRSTLRKIYVSVCYDETMNNIKIYTFIKMNQWILLVVI